ncbi:MAG: hypothetical protein ACOC22_02105 [bacterium]
MSITKLISFNQYVNVNLYIAKELKHPLSALLLGTLCSQYDYWEELGRLDDDGFFYITRDSLYDKSSLTHDMQRTAEKYLIKENLIEFKTKGIPPKNHYKINLENLLNFLNLLPKNQPDNTEKFKSGESQDSYIGDANKQISGMPTEINTNINTKKVSKKVSKYNKKHDRELIDKINSNLLKKHKGGSISSRSKSGNVSSANRGSCFYKNTNNFIPTYDKIISDFTDNDDIINALKSFIVHKEAKGKTLDNEQFKIHLKNLMDASNGDETKMITIIEKTIAGGWMTFNPLREDFSKNICENKNTNSKSYFIESDKKSFEEYEKDRENTELATDEDGNPLVF